MTSSADDASDRVIGELKHYFSPAIARALVTSTLRRVGGEGVVQTRMIAEVVVALERSLPMYIADAGRRQECVGRLRRLVRPVSVNESFVLGADPTDADPPRSVSYVTPLRRRFETAGATVIRVHTGDDVTNACEVGRDLARRVGFAHVQQTKIATAIAEVARNIILYAESGALHLLSIEAPRKGVEVLAIDQGPGIGDVELVLTGDYRSRSGMGMGLRGAKRLMDMLEIESSPKGTTVFMRKFV